ncbi:hypothetical protein Forpe1208_v000579 [Fusarium oxysporum f. sp. rapae]|uniref:Uncharacterized protein n=1 Tax=Fusarium oxysporum f. sp. rapae TaxID=485398 RepID=A0A8J5PHI5_FUSOX|nr:hypothetical protein Forpe1208_v000579 [Fusarium oxysporum f. sp. rapae]
MDLSPLAALQLVKTTYSTRVPVTQSVHERRKAACRVFNSRIPLSSPQPPRFFSLKFAQWETFAHLPDVWLALGSISSLNGPLSNPFSF